MKMVSVLSSFMHENNRTQWAQFLSMNFFQDDLIYQCKNVNCFLKYLIKSIYTRNSAVSKVNAKHPAICEEFTSMDYFLLLVKVKHLSYLHRSAETGAGQQTAKRLSRAPEPGLPRAPEVAFRTATFPGPK